MARRGDGKERVSADMAVSAEVTRGAQSWQFFAFVFAAVLSIVYAAINDIAERRWLRMAVKLGATCIVGYFTLVDVRGRNKFRLLGRFKKERSW